MFEAIAWFISALSGAFLAVGILVLFIRGLSEDDEARDLAKILLISSMATGLFAIVCIQLHTLP